MQYMSFTVLVFVAFSAPFGTNVKPVHSETIFARWNNNVAFEVRQDKRAAPVTTNPPTFSKHENIACVKLFGKNSDSGTKATCIKNPDCAAWQENGPKGKYCKGETKLDGWVNLKNQTGKQIVWIKETCSDKIKNQDEEDVDCGGAACSPCALVNSCGAQPSCNGNAAAPNCTDAVCKCGTNDGCLVATADTAPVCVAGTCKCAAAVDACTGDLKCINEKCQAACGDAPAACLDTEVCDGGVCKCQDKNKVNGTSCAGNPGGEICDATADAPTCKCTASVDSCSGNLLAPNCNATAGACECAPGDGGCKNGTLCVDGKCMCGDIPACDPASASPTCDFANSQCMCGASPGCADLPTADTCDAGNNKCLCGTADPCSGSTPVCKAGNCTAAAY